MPAEAFTYPLHVVQTQMAIYRLIDMQEELERLLTDLDRAVYLAEPLEINVDDVKHADWEDGLVLEAQRRMAVVEVDDAG